MRKISIIGIVAVAAFILYSCGNKKSQSSEKKEVEATEVNKPENTSEQTRKDNMLSSIDFDKIPESTEEIGVFPFVSDLPEFEGNNSASNKTKDIDFDKLFFYDGKGFFPFEGKLHYRVRLIKEGESFSAYKVQKSFEDMFKKMGAEKIFSGNARAHFDKNFIYIPDEVHDRKVEVGNQCTVLYALKKGDAHILLYLSVDGNYNGYYSYYVMQSGDLNQSLSLITADEMKKELNDKGMVTLYINFDTNKATIKTESEPIVEEIYTLLKDNADFKVSINGYTDNVGSADHNKKLSEARAQSVVGALIQKGISSNRLQAKGFGQDDPVADNRTDEGKAKNRRVEIVKIQ